ncbi:MAG: hypothetical protein HC817_12420 [Saprospiraceae bacterium]|nr:hypothetical protein [Saprospiraceae bacterium]
MVFNGMEDYKRDEKGEPVRTKLNENILRDIAQAGNGAYFNLANTRNIPQALKEQVDKLEKKEMEIRSYSEFESYYQGFLLPALAILLLEFMMPYRKSTWEERDIFKI